MVEKKKLYVMKTAEYRKKYGEEEEEYRIIDDEEEGPVGTYFPSDVYIGVATDGTNKAVAIKFDNAEFILLKDTAKGVVKSIQQMLNMIK